MKRYASLDFLRGIAIWIMLILHTVMRVYDRSWTDSWSSIEQRPIFSTLILILIAFLGGWAGFFLLISTICNAISMQNNLKKGLSVSRVLKKQLIIGFLLLIIAYLTESITGYHGFFGNIAQGNNNWPDILLRAYHMETIHTIAYALIINSIIHAILSIKGGYQKERRNITTYALLAILSIAITPSIWNMANSIYPDYINNQRPSIGSPLSEFIIKFFLLPLAGHPEPLFPFMAIGFIGCIIGILLSRKEIEKVHLNYGIYGSLVLIAGGLFGSIVYVALGKQDFIQLFINAWNLPSLNAWFPWFVFTLGIQLLTLFATFRLVEYRGRAETFANNTKYIRRHGFMALSIYNWQFLDLIPRWIMYGFGFDAINNKLNGEWTLFIIAINLLLWHIVLISWEKINYVGSFEWIINVLAGFGTIQKRFKEYIPGKEKEAKLRPWWRPIRLEVKESFYDIDWINLRIEKDIDHQELEDSKLIFKMAICSLLFFPLAILNLFLFHQMRRNEKNNKLIQTALVLSLFSIVINLGLTVFAWLTPLAHLGISL